MSSFLLFGGGGRNRGSLTQSDLELAVYGRVTLSFRSPCFQLPRVGIRGACHHVWPSAHFLGRKREPKIKWGKANLTIRVLSLGPTW